MELRWKLLANSRKAHLFHEGKSLCCKFLYLGTDYDGPYTGNTTEQDCAECVKRVKQIKKGKKDA